ncbi:hypothetical protein DSO57_1030952 [Entomophthora muscae]|uniref:Uncharacterized protein n=1 Tax=Entomophthora muscae TaxID=34485 RepID=A0ACC2U9U1_9FUNG|nr:hypothetical protein DSO57_1030952 [Entomophthora muscae]
MVYKGVAHNDPLVIILIKTLWALTTVPIGLVIKGINIGALDHKIGGLSHLKWVPDRFYSAVPILFNPAADGVSLSSPPPPESVDPAPLLAPEVPTPVPSHAPWLLTSLVLMRLNAYFPQLSPVSSLWSPIRAAVPVIHWAASWLFVPPG